QDRSVLTADRQGTRLSATHGSASLFGVGLYFHFTPSPNLLHYFVPGPLVPHRGNGVARKLEIAYLAWSLDCEAGDRSMAGTAAKIIVSERQQVLLKEFSKSRTVAKSVSQRATIVLLGFAGLLNEEIALQVGLNRQQVGIW